MRKCKKNPTLKPRNVPDNDTWLMGTGLQYLINKGPRLLTGVLAHKMVFWPVAKVISFKIFLFYLWWPCCPTACVS